ncbi:MAG: hypothetical protein LBI18_00785, partial [Planctomycetaceae bacterium]|nr:hypothetical protein [Planctomycetaceae bacterium]
DVSPRWLMFCQNITSAIADLNQCTAGNQIPNRLVTSISVRTQGQRQQPWMKILRRTVAYLSLRRDNRKRFIRY